MFPETSEAHESVAGGSGVSNKVSRQVRIYAVNYNVLKELWAAGLAYSN